MIKVSVEIEALDFASLIETSLPLISEQLQASGNPIAMLLSNGMSTDLAKKILSTLSQEQKELLTVDLINGNSTRISNQLESSSNKNGVSLHISSISASHL